MFHNRPVNFEQGCLALINKFQNSLQQFSSIEFSDDLTNILVGISALKHFRIELIKGHEYTPSACKIISLEETPFLEEILDHDGKFQNNKNIHFYYVLKFHNKIIGHLQFTHFNNGEDEYLHLIGIEILEKYQGNKLGNLLLSKLIEYGLQNQLNEIHLTTVIQDQKSRESMFKFYCNVGFKPTDEQPFDEESFLKDTSYEEIPWYQRTLNQKLAILLGKESGQISTYNLNIDMDLDLNNNAALMLTTKTVATAYKHCLFEQKLLGLITTHAEVFSQHSSYDFTKKDLLTNPLYLQLLASLINQHPYFKELEQAWQGIQNKQQDYFPIHYNEDDPQTQQFKQQFLSFILNMQSVNEFKNTSLKH